MIFLFICLAEHNYVWDAFLPMIFSVEMRALIDYAGK